MNFDSSNIWENYLCVSVDIGNFSEALRAAERVFDIRIEKEDLKKNALDEMVIKI